MEKRIITDTTANPAPLGLLAFGMTTVLLNFHNAGFYELGSMIIAMGIFYGGLAQVIAGIMEWKKGNTFAMVAFTSYGFFWLSLVGILTLPKLGLANGAEESAMITYFIMWGIFTFGMFIATLKGDLAHKFIFGSLTILFFMLALRDITGSAFIGKITGFEGIICGASAIYTGFALIINDYYKKTVLPLG
jgi:succinate-acetate transporter protein